eukprot:187717_1
MPNRQDPTIQSELLCSLNRYVSSQNRSTFKIDCETYSGTSRASVALILRCITSDTSRHSVDANSDTSRHSIDANSNTSRHSVDANSDTSRHSIDANCPRRQLEILYILRQKRRDDRWSGQVAFPGGRREASDTNDFDTVCRETQEEVGLDLRNQDLFKCIGRLDNRSIRLINQPEMTVCPFVFLQLSPAPLPISLQTSEVAAVIWADATSLCDEPTGARRVMVPFNSAETPGKQFAGVRLKPFETTRFVLWGLSLGMTAELFEVLGFPALARYKSSNDPQISSKL